MTELARRSERSSQIRPERDTEITAFGTILGELITRVPGAYACALVDHQGEAVDYDGLATPFEVKVAAAHLRILLQHVGELVVLGEPRFITVRGKHRSIIARQLPEGYALVVMLRRGAGFTASRRAFAACERALAKEAGWEHVEEPGTKTVWFPVHVVHDRRGRPREIKVRKAGVSIEVLGAVMGLPARERGFRVRTAAGTELTLVREPGSRWYADEPVDDLE